MVFSPIFSGSAKVRILADLDQIISKHTAREHVPAELSVAVHEDRNVLAEALFQTRLAVHVDDVELEWKTGLQRMQARDHVIAEMAVGAAVDGQPYRPQLLPSTRNGM